MVSIHIFDMFICDMLCTRIYRHWGVEINGFRDFSGGNAQRKTYVDYRDPHKGVKEITREIELSKIKIESVIGRGKCT